MLKKILALILSACMLASGAHVYASGGAGPEGEKAALNEPEEPLEILKLDEELPEAVEVAGPAADSLPARSAILIDQLQGTVIYEKNADEPLPPASITKVMTLLLAMEALESGRVALEDIVTASEYACSMGGSQIWLEPGEQMTVDELLRAIAISSANDASVAIGEFIAGTNDAFVEMMNERANALGMGNTSFLNCTGLDEPGHLTTARDIAIMSRELMKHPRIRDYSTVWMDSLRGGETELVNTNRLVRYYGGTTGLKTGTTNGAGSCLSATAERNGLGLVAVVMGCPTSDERFGAARSLLDYGFAGYALIPVPPIDEKLTPVRVLKGMEQFISATYEPPGSLVVNKQSKDAISQEITLVPDLEAPVYEGQIIGKVEVVVDGVKVTSYDLRAKTACERITVPRAFVKLVRCLFDMSGRKVTAPEALIDEGAPERGAEEESAPPEQATFSIV